MLSIRRLPSQRRSYWGPRRRQQSSTQHLLHCSSACWTWAWTETSCSRQTSENSSGSGWSDPRISKPTVSETRRTGRPVWSTPPLCCQCYWGGSGAAGWSPGWALIPAPRQRRGRWAEARRRQWCCFGSAHRGGLEESWGDRPASETWTVGPVGCNCAPGTRWRKKRPAGRRGWAVNWCGSWSRPSGTRCFQSRQTGGAGRLGQRVFRWRFPEPTLCGWPSSSLGEEVAGSPDCWERMAAENQELIPLEFWEKVKNRTSVLHPENLKDRRKSILVCIVYDPSLNQKLQESLQVNFSKTV